MDQDQKAQGRKEVGYILKYDTTVDYSQPGMAQKLQQIFVKNNLNQTAYGRAYVNELHRIETGVSTEFHCLFCKKVSHPHLICPECRKKITPVQEKAKSSEAPKREQSSTRQQTMAHEENDWKKQNADQVQSITASAKETFGKAMDTFTEKVNVMAGGTGKVDLRLKDLFSEVFKKHSRDESDELFICGTKTTTPAPESISTEWPKPWLFSRIALLFLATFYLMVIIYKFFSNAIVVPGVIFVGSAAIPICVLVFLFELNAPRNITFFETIKVFAIGGAASLLISSVLFERISVDFSVVGSILIGFIEEIAKLLILAYFIKKNSHKNYILNGMLYGGAVGAGFAVFESAGYALSAYMGVRIWGLFFVSENTFDSMMSSIYLRAFLSPGGHIAWAAMEGAFIMIVLNGRKFEWSVLFDKKFLTFFLIPVGMHAFWDMDILSYSIMRIPVKTIALVLVAWVILLVLLHRGLEEINCIKS